MIVQPYLRETLRGVVGLMWQGRSSPRPIFSTFACGPRRAAPSRRARRGARSGARRALGAAARGLRRRVPRRPGGALPARREPAHATRPSRRRRRGCQRRLALLRAAARPAVAAVRGRPGLFFRHLEGDLRSIVWRVRAGEMGPAAALDTLRPRRGTVHSFSTWRDPGPSRARPALRDPPALPPLTCRLSSDRCSSATERGCPSGRSCILAPAAPTSSRAK